jgi:hypothetical protein
MPFNFMFLNLVFHDQLQLNKKQLFKFKSELAKASTLWEMDIE